MRSGGFGLAAALQPAEGVAPPPEAFKSLGKSEFGSTFFKVEPLTSNKGDRSLIIAEQSVNWSLERIVLLNQSVHISINNIVSAFRIANDFPASECKFLRPEDQENFLRPWNHSVGVSAMTWRHSESPSNARGLSRKEILDVIRRDTDA